MVSPTAAMVTEVAGAPCEATSAAPAPVAQQTGTASTAAVPAIAQTAVYLVPMRINLARPLFAPDGRTRYGIMLPRTAERMRRMDNRFEVTASAGTLASQSSTAVHFPHRWTPGGVTVEADFTGGHVLNLAVASCVLNDVYREAATLGVEVTGIRVTAAGGFDPATAQSTGISYSIEVSSDAPADQVTHLLATVDRVAEIPKAVRAGAPVQRIT
jgi:uncharacterized OsmC-like protein